MNPRHLVKRLCVDIRHAPWTRTPWSCAWTGPRWRRHPRFGVGSSSVDTSECRADRESRVFGHLSSPNLADWQRPPATVMSRKHNAVSRSVAATACRPSLSLISLEKLGSTSIDLVHLEGGL
jgi:hypothetical protein